MSSRNSTISAVGTPRLSGTTSSFPPRTARRSTRLHWSATRPGRSGWHSCASPSRWQKSSTSTSSRWTLRKRGWPRCEHAPAPGSMCRRRLHHWREVVKYAMPANSISTTRQSLHSFKPPGGLAMRTRARLFLALGLIAAVPITVIFASGQPVSQSKPQGSATAGEDDKERAADREAIRRTGEAFAAAFEKGDPKAVAALWTDNAEYVAEDGLTLRQRAEIEKAFTEVFKSGSSAKVEVDVRSIRFPSRDVAIEEGFLRHIPSGPGLPSSSRYQTILVREDGKWLIAHSREWAAHEDRLGDLRCLIGQWEGGPKGEEMTLAFTKDPDGPFINGKCSRRVGGKAGPTGTMRIGLDPDRGQLRSWHYDADGGHGQCTWVRDGDRWVLDALGIAGDGTATASVNIVSRLGTDEIVWRSIDRIVAGQPLPDTVPVKLTRARNSK